jgi:hypothetical protein
VWSGGILLKLVIGELCWFLKKKKREGRNPRISINILDIDGVRLLKF